MRELSERDKDNLAAIPDSWVVQNHNDALNMWNEKQTEVWVC